MARLSEANIGFVGVGHMGESILAGGLAASVLKPSNVQVYDVRPERTSEIAVKYGVYAAEDLAGLVAESECLLYAAKPQNVPEVLAEVGPHIGAGHLVMSIAAGITTETWERDIEAEVPVVRAMPNIAASVREAMTGLCGGVHVEEEHLAMAEELFSAVGRTVRLPEGMLDVVTGLSASGPGFAFLIIEALADVGVHLGLTFSQARLLAAQMLLGSARLALDTEEHPAALKVRVTSAGGTAAAGLAELESSGVRAALARAVTAATERARALGGG